MRARILLLASLLTGSALLLRSYTQANQGGPSLRWPATAQIVVMMNSTLAPNNSPDLVRASLLSAFNTWNTALAANKIAVRFVDGGLTLNNNVGCDQVNVVTFTK